MGDLIETTNQRIYQCDKFNLFTSSVIMCIILTMVISFLNTCACVLILLFLAFLLPTAYLDLC